MENEENIISTKQGGSLVGMKKCFIVVTIIAIISMPVNAKLRDPLVALMDLEAMNQNFKIEMNGAIWNTLPKETKLFIIWVAYRDGMGYIGSRERNRI